jgi:two-component system chemotaxis response regulator CheB
MKSHDVVVIGGSAGSLEPLRALLGELPPSLPAAVFVVVHTPAYSQSMLSHVLGRPGAIPVMDAIDGAIPEPGRVYVAQPDHHLVLKRDRMLLTQAPRENQFRPAVDVLFRTAAVPLGSRVA